MAHVAENGCNQEWVHCRLADACSAINYGLTAPATDTPTGPKFLRITDIVSGVPKWDSVPYVSAEESEQEKYQLFNGDIVVARTGASTGVSAFIKDPPQALFASYLVRLQTKPEFDPRFVSYYLKSEEFWTFIRGVLGDKSAQPNASASTMTSAPFRAPRNLSDQQAIARVLGTLDDKIELNQRMNRTLEEMARTIFQDWFVDFGPVRAKMEGRQPYLPMELWDLFPNELVDSELGEIPRGWGTRTLRDCVDVERGLSYKGSGLSSNGTPMHNLNSVHEGGGYKDNGIKYYSERFQERHLVRPGDVIVTNTEQGHDRLLIGFAAIVPRRFGHLGLFSHHLYRVRPKNSCGLSPDFICHLLNTRAVHEKISGYATGTTVNTLPTDALRLPAVVVPQRMAAQVFCEISETIRARQEQHIEECHILKLQRDNLLPELVSGKVKLS